MQDTFEARRRMGLIELWEEIYGRPPQLSFSFQCETHHLSRYSPH